MGTLIRIRPENLSLASVRATTASVIVLVEPLTAAIIAMVFLDEKLTNWSILGMVVLMMSVLFLALSERHGRERRH